MEDGLAVAYLGLGSSFGDRFRNLRMAVTRLELLEPIVKVLSLSSLYESPHLGLKPSGEDIFPPHVNMVVKINTDLSPQELLTEARKIEDQGGRDRTILRGPRTIDIDILLYGSDVIDTDALKIPHPEMVNRAFVLVPLFEIEPELQLPDSRTIAELCCSNVIRSQRLEQVATASELLL
jgi:2-amino-4-hydroxy-6-hydroxymethyldihydropteridine diphosphokinase